MAAVEAGRHIFTFFTVAVDLVGLFAEREGTIHKAPADDAD